MNHDQFDRINNTVNLEAIWLDIRTHLEKKKRQVYEAIVNYPPPIPACDVQFNHLLEERTRITQELRRAQEIAGDGANSSDSVRLLREFIDTCTDIDDALAAKWKLKVSQLEKQS